MIFRGFLTALATIAALACGAGAGNAAPKPVSADENFLKAYDAFRAGDALKLQKFSAQLAAQGLASPVLAPYLEYWRLKLRLEDAPDDDVRAFLERESGSYLADRLRADWLKALGKRADWASFERELAPLVQDDLEIRCYAWLARLARSDESAYDEARAIWQEPREIPESCQNLADRLSEAGRFGVEDVWRRVRLLIENGQVSAARRALGYLPEGERHDAALFNHAMTAPKKLLAKPPKSLERRATREMVVLAMVRLGRAEPEAAVEVLEGKLGERLPEADAKYLWGRLAYEGARRLMPEARRWYENADVRSLSDEQLAWKTRAALRAGDWSTVRDSIDRMSADARRDPAWTYWYGRALAAQGVSEGAHAYYLRISAQPTFYGLLAAEELGAMAGVPEPYHAATDAEVEAARATPGLARALELYRLELRPEATREWVFSIRLMDDAQLLAAAELARRTGIFDRAINTADRTAHQHNYKVRYLAPFKDVFDEQARATGLEEAWLLGLVRQESRFIVDARSAAGARGLMQLMPSTARWVAKRSGMQGFSLARVSEVPINVALGTSYLKHVLDDLGHPVLASAAYNAGPGRARRWRDARPLEGAIYAETIPFNETRDYVKKVMANTMYYAQLIGGKLIPLKDRLGLIPPKTAGERFNEDLP
ncbi:MAG TPA: transglycosylase SLT domain-containing protein [Burkholderiales bacterium]|nr:transglycosylase SLT domain-containing protein [Burkholderiales bacterium]